MEDNLLPEIGKGSRNFSESKKLILNFRQH